MNNDNQPLEEKLDVLPHSVTQQSGNKEPETISSVFSGKGNPHDATLRSSDEPVGGYMQDGKIIPY